MTSVGINNNLNGNKRTYGRAVRYFNKERQHSTLEYFRLVAYHLNGKSD